MVRIEQCSGLLFTNRATTAVLQLIGAVIMGARVTAFYNKDRRVLSLLVVVAVVTLGMCGWALTFRPPPSTSEPTATGQGTHAGCPEAMTSVEYLMHASGLDWAAAWGGQLLFDALVFLFTLRKLISVRRSLGKRSFMALSLRDGVFYASTLETQHNSVLPIDGKRKHLAHLIDAVSCNEHCVAYTQLMVSRLMLNLRDLEHESHRLVIRRRYVALPASRKYEPKRTSAPPSPSRDTLPQSATSVGWFRASSTKRTSSNVFHVGNGSMIRATRSVQMHQPDCYFYNMNKRDTHSHPIPDPSNPTTDTPDTVNNPLCDIQTTEEQASTSNEGLHESE
ncbi:hypothetical protein EDD15DRAFT_2203294 [Pisolithus albus]|nr:hypothetical protein EDD15DRAFT_2203294 [Pisolithus albus]